MNERNCCDGMCEQGRDCPAQNVIEFQSRAGLHRAFMPECNSSGSLWIDFLTFWNVKLKLLEWWGALSILILVLSASLVGWAIFSLWPILTGIDLTNMYVGKQ